MLKPGGMLFVLHLHFAKMEDEDTSSWLLSGGAGSESVPFTPLDGAKERI